MSQAFYIGFSGHQKLGDASTIEFVSQQLRKLLVDYRQRAYEDGKDIQVYSALALGADQLFVNTALDLGIPVEAVIPCARYGEIFGSSEARDEYHRLLNSCQKVHRLTPQDCSEDAYLEAGQWIVDHSDLMILAWNGYPAVGKGGTADVASYARLVNCPFIHIHTRLLTTKLYGNISSDEHQIKASTSRKFAVAKETVYQGPVLTVNRYHMLMPGGKELNRDIVERPESVLVLPVTKEGNVLLIEEYDLGAEAWQLTLPGGKIDDPSPEGILSQAKMELRQETGYSAGKVVKLLDFYSHPGYIAHKVHLFVAYNLEWCPLELDDEEVVKVQTFSLDEALATTQIDYRCDPEASLALWLYAGSSRNK